MIRLSRFFIGLIFGTLVLPLTVLGIIHYQGLKQFATQTLMTELDSEAVVIRENLNNEIGALTGGLRLLTGHETIIKGIASLYYGSQVRERFENFINRYAVVSSLYLVTRDGRVREHIGGRIRPIERNESVRHLMTSLDKAYESGVLSGRVAVIEDKELVPDGDHKALIFISSISSVVVRGAEGVQGFLIAVVPFNNLLAQANRASHVERSIVDIGETLKPNQHGYISQFQRVQIGEKDYSPSINLYIRVSRSPESMRDAVNEAIRPFISYQIVFVVILMALFVLAFRPILRAFNALYGIIRRMEAGQLVEETTSRIWEFAHTERLLIEMQARIRQQVSALEENNHMLAGLVQEKDRYLDELSRLNQSLEEKVQERTNKLALILQRIETSNRIYNQVIHLRQELANDAEPEKLMISVVKHLVACELDIPFAVVLQPANELRNVYVDPDFNRELVVPIKIHTADYLFDNGLYSIPLPPPFGGGWLLFQTEKMREEALRGMMLFARELGSYLENRALTTRLAFWARTDGLTGLGNRIAFDQTMADLETSLDKEVGLFLIDVNGLKEINDTRGHEAGDALLKTVAERLRYCLQGMTGSLYRIGGDEFVILLEGDGVEQAQELMARLQQTQFRPATLAGREYGISFSVGYADSHKIPFSLLYKMADKAMYQQKQAYYEHKHAQRESGLEDSSESV